MQVQWQGVINRPPEALFPYLADARNEQTWHPQATRVEMTSDGPVGLGARFRGQYKGAGTLVYAITAHEPPRRVVFEGTARGMPFVATMTLAPTSSGGTQLTDRMELQPSGFFRLLAPLIRPLMQRQTAAAMANLKRTVEAGAVAQPGPGD